MSSKTQWDVEINQAGLLELPPEAAVHLGLLPGARVILEANTNRIQILRPATNLSRIYIEPTNICNLDCVTCMRNVWEEPPGRMSAETFNSILDGVRTLPTPPTIFFGGYGEPLTHPDIVGMVRQAKETTAQVELITNGILLTESMSLELIKAGLDWLWVSLDGATPECYEDVRLGATLPLVIENLKRLRDTRYRVRRFAHNLQLGIAFVAMKRNIAELPRLLRLGAELGAKKFSVSNVLAHTTELKDETLYDRSLREIVFSNSTSYPVVNLPRIDTNTITELPLSKVLSGNYTLQVAGHDTSQAVDACPFVEKGSTSIRWDGQMSPCLPLLHTHKSFLQERPRLSKAYTVGSIRQRSLSNLWNDPEYLSLRQRLQKFDFAPCTYCNCCDMPEQNVEDCINNTFPACGACLWAQGIIQCP